MKSFSKIGIIVVLLASLQSAATAQAQTVDAVMAKMEQANKDYPSLQAKIKLIHFTEFIGAIDTKLGKIWISHTGTAPRQIKVEFEKPLKEQWLIDKSVFTKYFPNTKSGLIYRFDKDYQPEGECIIIGFCQSSSFIKLHYIATVSSPEVVDGVRTTVLELTPKDAKRAANFKQIKLWLDASKGYPIKSRVTLPNGNYNEMVFTEISPKSFSGSVFKIDIDRKADMQEAKNPQ